MSLCVAYPLAIKFNKKLKEKQHTLNQNIQNELRYYHKANILEANRLMMKHGREGFIYLSSSFHKHS